MLVRDTLLPEFDHEMAMTRLALERAATLPAAALDWRPHPKSFTLGALATHLAQLPRWGISILTKDFHDLADTRPDVTALPSLVAVLEMFDAHVREVRAALVEMPDGQLLQPWALRRGDRVVLSVPRVSALRGFVVRHTVHHRGQLTVYLRMHDVPLPPLYGPTADEMM
jgi:uncharacterized damage-inducible protein DinB